MTETTAPEVCRSSVDGDLLALFEAAQRWIHEQGLVRVEIESILGQTGKLLDLYQGRLTAEKLPPSLRTPYELMAWTRPVRVNNDVTGLEQDAHWFARWLVVCLPGNKDLQDAVSGVKYSFTVRSCYCRPSTRYVVRSWSLLSREPKGSYTDGNMSDIDKRRRTDLDLFVLALIDGGVATPYELQKAAGLSQGATIPALQRLLAARFVRRGKPRARRRTDYKVTATGKKLLQDGWLPLIEAGPSGDLDSDLRVALLAIWGSGDRRLAADFLRQSGDKKMESIATTELAGDPGDVTPLARWYAEVRSEAAKALLTAECSVIRAMAASLPRSLTGKRGRSAHPPKGQRGS
jgi:DNA-binding PadR family transcriptional regulator